MATVGIDAEPDEATQAAAWRLLEAGDTLGISQVESTGFRMLLKRAKGLAELQSQHGQALRSVEDLAQLLAIWKPGVYTKDAEEAYFLKGFAAHQSPTYAHPALGKVLDSTHGHILYAVMWTPCGLAPSLSELYRPSSCSVKVIGGASRGRGPRSTKPGQQVRIPRFSSKSLCELLAVAELPEIAAADAHPLTRDRRTGQ
jgi:DNA polymerase III alpha subunit